MFFKSAKYRKAFLKSLLFVLPGVIITLVFVIYPVINTAWLSLNSWNGIGGSPIKWVGLQNYIKTLTSVKFWNSMLNANFGVLAQFLKAIGHSEWIINWLATPTVNIWCVVLVNEWMYAGYNMLIFAAGIVAIPDDVHEAALLDGCTGIKKVIYITAPLCKNMFMVFSVLCITGCLKAFDIVWAMTNGGPMDSSATPAVLLYTQGFQYKLMGRSGSISIILLVLGLILSLLLNNVIFKERD